MTEPRHEHDFYATDSRTIRPLLKVLGWENGGKVIRENSCGVGHLSIPLEAVGHTVISTDLIDRGYGIGGIDFLKDNYFDTLRYDATIMNPPYSHALEFIKKALTQSPIVCAFLRLAFLEGGDRSGRYEFFSENPPWKVLVFSDRVPSAKNGDFKKFKDGKTAYMWAIWKVGNKNQPTIEWIRL